jgi:hypothetical protein
VLASIVEALGSDTTSIRSRRPSSVSRASAVGIEAW